MGVEHFDVTIDNNPDGVFFPGQIVEGRVFLSLSEEKKMRGIEVKFKGEANVYWRDSHGTGDDRKSYRYHGQETYFNQSLYVLGSPDGSIMVPAGEYVYPYAYQLPTNLPSSYEHTVGQVRYSVKANLDLPWAFDKNVKRLFTVINLLDLNQITTPRVSDKVKVENSKDTGWFSKSILSLSLILPKTGFVPGEKINMSCEIINGNKNDMEGIKAKLVEETVFHATDIRRSNRMGMHESAHSHGSTFGRHRINMNKVVEFKAAKMERNERIPGHGSVSWTNLIINVPPLPPTSLPMCNIISINHYIEFDVRVPGLSTNLSVKVPIVIGSIPLQNEFQRFQSAEKAGARPALPPPSAPQMPAAGASAAPSAPMLPTQMYADLPPPSYEEVIHDGNPLAKEDEDENVKGNWDFRPRYLRYHSVDK